MQALHDMCLHLQTRQNDVWNSDKNQIVFFYEYFLSNYYNTIFSDERKFHVCEK